MVNGGLIGLGVGWLILTWLAYQFTQNMQVLAEVAGVEIVGVWPAILAGVIGGPICIAFGIGLETYQRTALKRSVHSGRLESKDI